MAAAHRSHLTSRVYKKVSLFDPGCVRSIRQFSIESSSCVVQLKRSESKVEESLNGRTKVVMFDPVSRKLVSSWVHGDRSFMSKIAASLRATFLPIGYPHTVHYTYLRHHIWLSIETALTSVTSVLCNQAMLECLGMGGSEATAVAVAIQWVLKDGFGEIGKLFFTKKFASSFDSHPKTWKFLGEIINNVGSFFMLATLIAPPSWFLPLASLGNSCRSISFLIWGATHAYFSKNFALQNNVGDVVAKADSQMVVAHLSGMALGIAMISFSHTPLFLFSCYAALIPVHLIATVNSLKAANFELLNDHKALLITQEFLTKGKVLSPSEISKDEKWFGEFVEPRVSSPRVQLGVSVAQAFESEDQLNTTVDVLRDENYLLAVKDPHDISILLHEDAQARDILRSFVHASSLFNLSQQKASARFGNLPPLKIENTEQLREMLIQSHEHTDQVFETFVEALENSGWQSDSVAWSDTSARVTWEKRDY
eukprot:GILK01011567.1.p1 GENE.GILK01011567.1~~GILK01011567.1.p1  ORF type:complete len:508 (+),score=60.23 GILK01011567.1:81-1526(+)